MKHLYLTLFFVFLALVVAGFVFWRYLYLATVTIDPVPSEATVTVNSKPTPDRVLRLSQGRYTITVSAPGYRTEELTFDLSLGTQVTKRVVLTALPQPAKLLEGPIQSLLASGDRKIFFFERGGVLYRYDTVAPAPTSPTNTSESRSSDPAGVGEGTPAQAITPQLERITKVDWAPDFTLALLYKDKAEVGLYDFQRYNFLNQTYTPLGTGIVASAWERDGSAIYLADTENGLIKTNRAGSNPTRYDNFLGFPLRELELTPSQANQLLLSTKDLAAPADIHLFNAHERTATPVTESNRAYGPVVSPDAARIAYSDNGELVAAESDGKNKRNLGVRAKVGNYQFVDTVSLAVLTPNQLTVVNTTDGKKETFEVYAPSDTISALFAGSDGKSIYYVYQGDLYKLKYKE